MVEPANSHGCCGAMEWVGFYGNPEDSLKDLNAASPYLLQTAMLTTTQLYRKHAGSNGESITWADILEKLGFVFRFRFRNRAHGPEYIYFFTRYKEVKKDDFSFSMEKKYAHSGQCF